MCSLLKQNLPLACISYRSKLHHIHDEHNIIGRRENCFLHVRDAFISRNHCIIEKTPDHNFTIRQMSTHATFVNDRRLRLGETRRLKHKDEIKLTDKERRVPMIFLLNSKLKIHGRMKKMLLDLTESYLAELKKIDEEISEVEAKKSRLEEENMTIDAKESLVGGRRISLSIELTPTNEVKDEVENKIEEIEEKINDENKEKVQDVELKILKLVEQKKELQLMKENMEINHHKEREKLGIRWQDEIDKMKKKVEDIKSVNTLLSCNLRKRKYKLILKKKLVLRFEVHQYRISKQIYGLQKEKSSLQPQQESNIITKDHESDVVMEELEKKLKEKEEAEKKHEQDIAELEETLLCSICAEIFLEPKVLNCGHLFCTFCIRKWRNNKNSCPVCREAIKSCIRIHSIDSIIEKNIAMISDEAKERRKHLIKQRSKVAVVRPTRRARCCHSMRHSPVHLNNQRNSPGLQGTAIGLNLRDEEMIVLSPDLQSNEPMNASRSNRLQRLYRNYMMHSLRNRAQVAATATRFVAGSESTNALAFPEIAQPQRQDGPTLGPINLIDLTNQ